MALSPGTQLGSFEISGLLGVGGMGEVYRARDTKLGREVAIKVLPEVFAKDKDRLARFEREAKLLASLDHPNIAAIYELQEADGVRFLVMQLVEGQTLADRFAGGPVPIDEALQLFAQIAEALESAHEHGVIHRDLKPANIKVTDDGKVKILDFGLAKAFGGQAPSASRPGGTVALGSDSAGVTGEGKVLGTPAYMAPEQASGKPVDKRADIWAFGCCLYEALTGKRPFAGSNATELVADIIKGEPDWNALPANTPPRVRILLWRCLQKNPQRRLRDIGEARFEISETSSDPSGAIPALGSTIEKPAITRLQFLVGMAAAVVLGLVVASVAVWNLKPSAPPFPEPAPQPVKRLSISLSPTEPLAPLQTSFLSALALSPDGTQLVYVAEIEETTQLVHRPLAELVARPLPGTQGAAAPFFSPDGRSVGFFAFSESKLKKVLLTGGAAVPICDATFAFGASWGPDDFIIFSSQIGEAGGLRRVSAVGGDVEQLTTPDAGDIVHAYPHILPGGRDVLFTAVDSSLEINERRVMLFSLDTREQTLLAQGAFQPQYAATGHLFYAQLGVLTAVPFDLEALKATGPPASVTESRMAMAGPGMAGYQLAFSTDGTLVYVPVGPGFGQERTLVWVNREGEEEPLSAPPRAYYLPRLSPDGTRVAVAVHEGGTGDVWIHDLAKPGSLTRLTFNPGFDSSPLWTPDGERLVFFSTREGEFGLYWKPAGGTGSAEPLTTGPNLKNADSWSADGKLLAFSELSTTAGMDLLLLSMEGERAVRPLLRTPFNEWLAEISPDGRWMAYGSNEDGQPQVYVRPFPDVEQWKEQISTEGGDFPVWSPDGRELFYLSGQTMMVVSVDGATPFTAGTPEPLFSRQYFTDQASRNYDVTRDGRFLMVKESEEGAETPPQTEIIVVENWFEELKRLAPVREDSESN